MQDHGSFSGPVDLSGGRDKIPVQDFDDAPGGEGCSHAIDPENPNTVYSAIFYGAIRRSDLSRKDDLWGKSIKPVVYENEPKLRGQWVAPIILSPHAPHTVFIGFQNLFRSVNRGDAWEKISPDLSYNDPNKLGDIPYQTIFTVSESPIKYGLIYAGTDDGRAHISKDGGKTWQEITAGLVANRWISRIVASSHQLGTVYLTQNGKRDDDFTPYIWKSTDFGKSWRNITGNIPLGPVNVIREDPEDPKILYLGTDLSVYASKDGGQTWQVLGKNLPSVYVLDLVIHPRDNIIVIATHGRGMWALDANPINEKDKQRRNWYDD
jgi:photosystem II stability/assembly factor-like uncharacterized protein